MLWYKFLQKYTDNSIFLFFFYKLDMYIERERHGKALVKDER